MRISWLKRNFYLHELILAPAFIVCVFLSWRFQVTFDFLPLFSNWVLGLLLFAFFFALFVLLSVLAVNLFREKDLPIFRDHVRKIFMYARIFLVCILILVIYENLQSVIHIISPIDRDSDLIHYDLVFFNFSVLNNWLQNIASPYLTELMNLVYLSFFFYIPILAVYFYINDKKSETLRFVTIITIIFFLGYVFYLLVPAVGPELYLNGKFQKDLEGVLMNNVSVGLLNLNNAARNCFPSLHVACTFAYLYVAYRNSKYLFCTLLPIIILLWVSTIYLRQHYLIDVVFAFPFTIGCILSGNYLFKFWYEKRLDN